MSSDCVEKMYSSPGYKKGLVQHRALVEKTGFACFMLLGEVMYAYMICWLDVGYAVTTLFKFSSTSSECYYKLLKCLTQYLH